MQDFSKKKEKRKLKKRELEEKDAKCPEIPSEKKREPSEESKLGTPFREMKEEEIKT